MTEAETTKKNLDPLDIHGRLYQQVGYLLDQLEERDKGTDGELSIKITLKERIAALIAVGRIMTIFSTLRRREPDDPDAGKSVRKYQGAFTKPNEAGRGKTGRRRSKTGPAEPSPDPWFERDTAAGLGDGDDDAEFDA